MIRYAAPSKSRDVFASVKYIVTRVRSSHSVLSKGGAPIS